MATPGKLYKADAIILSRIQYGETDRIVTVFTREHGKLRLMAKGVRRVTSRRSPHLEIFTHCSLVIRKGRGMDSVSDVSPVDVWERLRNDLDRVSVAYLYCELVAALVADRQEQPDVYDLLLAALNELDSGDKQSRFAASRAFTLELLWTLGFLPRSEHPKGARLHAFVESVTERHLKSPKILRQLL